MEQLVVRNVGLLARGNAYNAVYAEWTWPAGQETTSALPAVFIEDVTVSTYTGTSWFVTGFCLVGADNSRIVNCHINQVLSGSYGIVLDNSHSPSRIAPDTQIVGCQIVAQDCGVWLRGLVEGTRIVNCSFLGNQTGLLADGPSNFTGTLGWVYVNGCHFDIHTAGIDARSVTNLHAQTNYFIAQVPCNNFASCISMTNTKDSLVTNNIFRRGDNTTTVVYAIKATGSSNVLIDANRYCGAPPGVGSPGAIWTATAWLDANTSGIRYSDTNLTDGYANGPVNNAGAANTIG